MTASMCIRMRRTTRECIRAPIPSGEFSTVSDRDLAMRKHSSPCGNKFDYMKARHCDAFRSEAPACLPLEYLSLPLPPNFDHPPLPLA